MKSHIITAVAITLIACGSSNLSGTPDAYTDPGECTPLGEDPPPGESFCNPLDRCGCDSDDWCGVFILPDPWGATCLFRSACAEGDPGSIAAGEACPFPIDPIDGPHCAPGTVCVPVGGSTATCRQLCRTSENCGSGSCVPGPAEVLITESLGFCGPGTMASFPYSICSD